MNDLREKLLVEDYKTLTGTIEHWLTTYYRGFWGFPDDRKDSLEPGDMILLCASKKDSKRIDESDLPDEYNGIIGVGVVESVTEKDEKVWLGEIDRGEEFPYPINFSTIYWFGNVEGIEKKPVGDKTDEQLTAESAKLAENNISRDEVIRETSYNGLPNNRNPQPVGRMDEIMPLLESRLDHVTVETYSHDSVRKTSIKQSEANELELRDITEDDKNRSDVEDKQITVSTGKEARQEADKQHEGSLFEFAEYLRDKGYEAKEKRDKNGSDLVAYNEEEVIVFEHKSIANKNTEDQIRKAVGQLEEYSFFDIIKTGFAEDRTIRKGIVLANEPSDKYKEFLDFLSENGFLCVWYENGQKIMTEETYDHFE